MQAIFRRSWRSIGFDKLPHLEEHNQEKETSSCFSSCFSRVCGDGVYEVMASYFGGAFQWMASVFSVLAPIAKLTLLMDSIDTDMDVLAAAQSHRMLSAEDQTDFKATWEHTAKHAGPLGFLCTLVASWGMSETMLVIVVCTALLQILVYAHNYFDAVARRKRAVYIPMLELGGLPFLADVMHPLPQATSNASALLPLARALDIFFGCWFQISLLSLVIDDGLMVKFDMEDSVMHLSLNSLSVQLILSVGTSTITMITIWKKTQYLEKLLGVLKKWVGNVRMLIWMLIWNAIFLALPSVTLARFVGVWACPSHTFQLSTLACFEQ